ncbi:MAG: S8 family serine peptidase [Candidatus Nitrosocaldus sp.]|nr:S8 family serine peptidase [Candidatus Nitrosocaldus sp.]
MYDRNRRRARVLLASTLSLLLLISTIPNSHQMLPYSRDAPDGSNAIYLDAHGAQLLSGIRKQSMLISLDGLGYEQPADASRVIILGRGDLDPLIADRVFSYVRGADGSYIASASIADEAIPFLEARGLRVIRDFMVTLDHAGYGVTGVGAYGQYEGKEMWSSVQAGGGQGIAYQQQKQGGGTGSGDGSGRSGGGGASMSMDASRFSLIYDLDEIHAKGVSGKGVRIAIVDSGVDFSSADMRDAVARDEQNRPIMLDADAQGIVLTSARFIARIVDGMVVNAPLPDEYKDDQSVSNVYVDDTGVYLNIKNREKGMRFEVYNSIYPYISPLKFTATSSMDWKIGKSATDFIQSKSGVYRMGFFLQLNFHLGSASLIIVPVLLVDSREAGVYDTVIADMSTAWADFAAFELRKNPEEVKFDFDFTDEVPRRVGDGNEMLLYDADNDGNPELSAGMLGAYVLDVWGVIQDEGKGGGEGGDDAKGSGSGGSGGSSSSSSNGNGSHIDPYLGAVNGRLLEPVDRKGRYFTVMFDFFGHGTQSAGTIVSRGVVDYPVYESQQHKIKGIAPDAKIVPVKALWFGDIAYAWLWASGFEQVREEIKVGDSSESTKSSANSNGDGRDTDATSTTSPSSPSQPSPAMDAVAVADDDDADHSRDSGTDKGSDGNVRVEWRWVYTGKHRADIINNSWGIPSVPILDHGAGYDIISMLATALSIPGYLSPEYPGVLMVNSAGNSGHAYGTVSAPATSPLALAVGATTNNVIVGLEFTKKQPRFGNSLEYYDDIVDFSSKGPSVIGDVKPDILATGAYGFTPLPVNSRYASSESVAHAFGVFGGTSMAAPIVAGSAALLIEGMREKKGMEYDPMLVKALLMSTARDLKHDPFTQGAGRVDPLKALEYLDGSKGSFIVYTDDTYGNYLDVLKQALDMHNLMLDGKGKGNGRAGSSSSSGDSGEGKGGGDGEEMKGDPYGFRLTLPTRTDIISGKWYAGYIGKGSSKAAEFTIVNGSDERLKVSIEPTMLRLISASSVDGRTTPREKDPAFNSEDYGYIPNYIRVGKNGAAIGSMGSAGAGTGNGAGTEGSSDGKEEAKSKSISIGLLDIDTGRVKDSDLMVAKVYYPFESFMNTRDPLYANELRIASLYAYEWRDEDRNSSLTYTETAMINRAGAWGTVQHLSVIEPFKRVDGELLLGVYPVPRTISYWFGNTQKDAEPFEYRLVVAFYKKDRWDMVDVDGGIVMRDEGDGRIKNMLFIEPRSKATFRVEIDVPEDAREGIYQGFITVSSDAQVTNIPVSFVVPVDIGSRDKDVPVVIGSMMVDVDVDEHGESSTMMDGKNGGSDANDNSNSKGESTSISIAGNNNSSNNSSTSSNYGTGTGTGSTGSSEDSSTPTSQTVDVTDRYMSNGVTLLYDNSIIAGAFDMLGRYNSGEWKYYHLNITDPSINVLSMKLTWKSMWSSVDVFVVDPQGRIIATNVPGGVFKTFINWPSNDWLGRTAVSGGGGFYPSQNNGENSSVLYIPIDSTGVYSIMLHTTLFAAEQDLYEPLQIEVKPASIIPDVYPPTIRIDAPEYARGIIDVGVEVVDDNIEELVYSIDGSPPSSMLGAGGMIRIDGIADGSGYGHGSGVGDGSSMGAAAAVVVVAGEVHGYDGSGSGDGSSTVINNEGSLRSGKISIDTSRLADGPHTITIIAKDKAGHRSLSSAVFTVDNTPPLIMVGGLDAYLIDDGSSSGSSTTDGAKGEDADGMGSRPVAGMLRFSVDVRDANISSIRIILPDGSVMERQGQISIDTTRLGDGVHEIKVVAEDKSGNLSEVVRRFSVDNTPPVVSILDESGKTVSGVFELRYSVAEENLKQLLISIDGNARVVENTGSFTINTMDLIDGRHRVEVMAEDGAGHVSTAGIEFTTINYEPMVRAQIEDARSSAHSEGLTIGLVIGLVIAAASVGAVVAVMRHRAGSRMSEAQTDHT